MIYMDNAATTKMRPEVLRAMLPYMGERFSNPSGIYSFSQNVRKEVERARTTISNTINAKPNEIFFTSGGTESDNWALKMTAKEYGKGHIITTEIEHQAILKSCEYLEMQGFEVTKIRPGPNGIINVEDVIEAVKDNTILISVMMANNEIGSIQPISRIGAFARKHGILFHTDAVQAYTNIPIDVNEMNIDMLSASGHKFNGPKGTGFLYIREGCLKLPFINGGGQEMHMRAGTENVAGIIGLEKAAQIALNNQKWRVGREIYMRDYMIQRIENEIDLCILNGDRNIRLPNNINFSFQYVEGASLILMLDTQGICASAGSACSSHDSKPSHVLTSIGMPEELAYGTVRFSISEDTGKNEIDYVIECLKKDIFNLRKNSESYNMH